MIVIWVLNAMYPEGPSSNTPPFGQLLTWLSVCSIVVPAGFRRFHDMGITGWPAIGFLIPVVIAPLLLLVCLFWPGTRGENRFGVRDRLTNSPRFVGALGTDPKKS
jgi:uncharacterized membrane protein YhaH (DUF805 family)